MPDSTEPTALESCRDLTLEVRPGTDELLRRDRQGFELVESWPPRVPGESGTEFYRRAGEFGLRRRDLGWARFGPELAAVVATAAPGVALPAFEAFVRREWLPQIFPVLGCQVLHAGAAVHLVTGRVVGFCGPSGCGKSTMAFAMERADGWGQLADDVLAFCVDDGAVSLVPLPDDRHLRTPSAEFLGERPGYHEIIAWPEVRLGLGPLYFLRPAEEPDASSVRIDAMTKSRAFEELLGQAFSASVQPRDLRARLVEDYLELAANREFFTLTYPRRLEMLDRAVETVAEHALA